MAVSARDEVLLAAKKPLANTPPEGITNKGGDIALHLASNEEHISPELTLAVRWKIDLYILPLLSGSALLQSLDRLTLSYAAIFGLIEDLNLQGSEFSWLVSIYYFGYLVMQPLGGYLMRRFPPAKCLAFSVFLWGVALFMHIVSKSWASLMAVRFFLGMAEGIVIPGCMLITTAWYSRRDQPFRMGIWTAFIGLMQIVGGILAYGLGHIHINGIASWKWIFIATGAISILWSIVLLLLLPDSQLTAWFLRGDDEKRAAIEIVRQNNTGIYARKFKREQLIEGLLDPKTWALFFMAVFCAVPNAIAAFGTQLVMNFGFSSLQTTLLGMPIGAVQMVSLLAITYICSKLKNARTYSAVVGSLISAAGCIMMYVAPYSNKAALLSGYYIFYPAIIGYTFLLSLSSANIAGHTKKVTVNAILTIGLAVGNISGPQFFKPEQAPRYGLGIAACLVSLIIFCVLTLGLGFHLTRLNRKRRSHPSRSGDSGDTNLEFFDLTDQQNPKFVYVY